MFIANFGPNVIYRRAKHVHFPVALETHEDGGEGEWVSRGRMPVLHHGKSWLAGITKAH